MTALTPNFKCLEKITAVIWVEGGYFFSLISIINLITLQRVLIPKKIRTNSSINYHLLSELEESRHRDKYALYFEAVCRLCNSKVTR